MSYQILYPTLYSKSPPIIPPNFYNTRKLFCETPNYHGNSYTFTQNSDTITETPDFCVKVYFCLIVRFLPLSPSYQRHPKTKKLGPTTHRGEPHQALKPLILSHSSILLPASTQIPMASIQDCRLCCRQPCNRHSKW